MTEQKPPNKSSNSPNNGTSETGQEANKYSSQYIERVYYDPGKEELITVIRPSSEPLTRDTEDFLIDIEKTIYAINNFNSLQKAKVLHLPKPAKNGKTQKANTIEKHLHKGIEFSATANQVAPTPVADLTAADKAKLSPCLIKYFKELEDIVGISNYQPSLGKRLLEQLQTELISKQGAIIKNTYMKRLAAYGLCFTALALFLDLMHLLDAIYCFTWIGVMIGAWLSFGIRKTHLSLDDLTHVEDDLLGPAIRLIFIGFVTMILLLLISTGFISIEIGDINLSSAVKEGTYSISNSPEIQVLFGALCGLSELTLPSQLKTKAETSLTF